MDNLGRLELKKAFEVSYAVLRLAANIDSRSFRAYFEEYGLKLMDAVVRGDKKTSGEAILGLDYFIKLSSENGLISQASAQVVAQELLNLNAAISEISGLEDQASELKQIFSKGLNLNKLETPVFSKGDRGYEYKTEEESSGLLKPAISGNLPDSRAAVSGDRSSSIVQKIRQSGYCRLSDIQSVLPDVSERTIRYDLERMIQQGIVERFGGGPATYYRVKREVV